MLPADGVIAGTRQRHKGLPRCCAAPHMLSHRGDHMAKKMILAGMLSLAGTAIFTVLYMKTACGLLLPLAITFGTASYHIIMRLLVGLSFQAVMQNRAEPGRRWYRVGKGEMAVYEALKVKRWKRRMPTFDNARFNPQLHSWDEIAQAMCQAELVHETIVILSFLPIAEGIWFGMYPVFIVTSVLAAGYDLMFVMMQRYNRQRIFTLLARKSASVARPAQTAGSVHVPPPIL